ncbi:MAG: LacI family transcriptional regulator [Phycisphaerae bacterium]|nr:LacI family transcriptional regulator [Phycisphaerae bacterium]
MEQTRVSKKPTVVEVARRARVSRAAVYAVLNADRPTNIGISDEKRRRVLEAARELGYVRNELARSLVTGRTHTIGVLVHTLKTHFYTDFFTYMDDACHADGYSVFVSSSEFDGARERRNLEAYLAKRVDAVAIARGQPGNNDDVLQRLISQGVVVVILGEVDVPDLPYPVVGFDEGRVGDLTAEHLRSLGHRRVLYLSAGRTRDNSLRIHSIRAERFAQAWRQVGGEGLERFDTADPVHGGMELAEALAKMPEGRRPTAVACSTDRLAISLVSSLRMHRLRVPRDISVIGCDDIDAAAECTVPLTTVRLPTDRMAEGAWRLIKGKLGSEPADSESGSERLIIQPELVIRESTEKARNC